jgi:molecular chaperone HtpG
VQHECRELLPEYLRFMVGIVDAEDLPLNISRETLQDNQLLRKIRGTLIRKVLDKLVEMTNDPAMFRTFYQQFGAIIKEGFHEDFDREHRGKLAKLLRFPSTHSQDAEDWVSFEEYLARAKEQKDQNAIYYLGAANLAAARGSAHLEAFRKRNWEVLLPTEPIDEFVLNVLGEYEGKKLISADSAEIVLPQDPTSEKAEELPTPGFERVLTLFRTALAGRVKDVRESKRLVDSPCCLTTKGPASSRMQHLIKQAQGVDVGQDRILEVNPRSPFIKRLAILSTNPDRDEFIQECGRQLLDNALILEGVLDNPQDVVNRIQKLMGTAADQLSAIIV